MGLLGTLFVWVFLPFVNLDPFFETGSFTVYTGPLNVVFGLSAGTFSAICMSALYNGQLGIRDVVYGSLAGGIAVTTAGTYITNPVYSLLLGVVAGGLQVLFMNFRKYSNSNGTAVFYSYPVGIFAWNGFLGSAWSAWNNAVVQTNADGFLAPPANTVSNSSALGFLAIDASFFQILMGLMAIAFAIGFGLVVGILYLCTGAHIRRDHFTDTTYWLDDDGISYANKKTLPEVAESDVEVEFYEGDDQIKNIHAYL